MHGTAVIQNKTPTDFEWMGQSKKLVYFFRFLNLVSLH